MTVREVAEILGVTPEAIKWHVRKMYPESIRNGIETTLTEVQITEIKKKMIPTSQLVGTISDLEAAEMLIKSAEHFKARFEQERQQRIEAEKRLAIAEPKAEILNKITATNNDVSVRELAAILAIPQLGQNNLFDRLRKGGYIDGYNRPSNPRITFGASLTARLTRSGLRWSMSGTLKSKLRRAAAGQPRNAAMTRWPPCPGIRGAAPAPIPGSIVLPEAPDTRTASGWHDNGPPHGRTGGRKRPLESEISGAS
jgi:DNA-binding Lrp family transcriptional regulator